MPRHTAATIKMPAVAPSGHDTWYGTHSRPDVAPWRVWNCPSRRVYRRGVTSSLAKIVSTRLPASRPLRPLRFRPACADLTNSSASFLRRTRSCTSWVWSRRPDCTGRGTGRVVVVLGGAGRDLLDLRAAVVAGRQVEAQRPAAAAAFVAVALPQLGDRRARFLRPLELPRVEIFGDDGFGSCRWS